MYYVNETKAALNETTKKLGEADKEAKRLEAAGHDKEIKRLEAELARAEGVIVTLVYGFRK